jgi:hypothetical protein
MLKCKMDEKRLKTTDDVADAGGNGIVTGLRSNGFADLVPEYRMLPIAPAAGFLLVLEFLATLAAFVRQPPLVEAD